jgi:hypothetical protein
MCLVIELLVWIHASATCHIYIFFFTGSTAPLGPGLCFQFHDHFTDGRTPWTSDQLIARPLPKHRTTQTQNKHIHNKQTQNKHIHTTNIHALCGIWTHDPGFQASEDSSCLRPLSHRNRRHIYKVIELPQVKNKYYN